MTPSNSKNISFWKNLQNRIIKVFKIIQQNFDQFSSKYPNTVQIIQLTFIYYFALRWLFGLFYSFQFFE